MALNLSRNTKLLVTTAGNTTFNNTNTFEVPPLSGYTFTQDTAQTEISVSEAGTTPSRGTQAFNSAINPAQISFSTYIRAYRVSSGTNVSSLEQLLWDAFFTSDVGASSSITQNTTALTVATTNSNTNHLQKLDFYFILDNTTYKISDVVLNTATIDFSIDAISKIDWAGLGKLITEDHTSFVAGTNYLAATGISIGGTEADFIENKLSTLTITDANPASTALSSGNTAPSAATYFSTTDRTTLTVGAAVITTAGDFVGDYVQFATTNNVYTIVSTATGASDTIVVTGDASAEATTFSIYAAGSHSGTVYTVPITGGSLTIDNGVTFLTPESLGVVNQPIDHFTGARSVKGTVTAYLNTGAQNTAGILDTLANDLASVSNKYVFTLTLGGAEITTPTNSTTAVGSRVTFSAPQAQLTIPTIDTQDVISTSINFTGQNTTLGGTDDLTVKYYFA